ncbi:MAG: adaptor protein MecA [Lachnospiraceae bacterium]
MKIEKVNENQIRCTLTKEDLADRELKISELAYGTEKAKSLFREMMQQASFEFGFEAEDIPLMIEAIPLSPECIVLVITKVEDPEELDTRFAKFAPSIHEDADEDNDFEEALDDTDEVLDLFKKLHAGRKAALESMEKAKTAAENNKKEIDAKESETVSELTRIFVFTSLHDVTDIAAKIGDSYEGKNSLYKDESEGIFLLLVSGTSDKPKEFNRICNVLSEYGTPKKSLPASLSYMEEHFTLMIRNDALHVLSRL